MIKIIKKSVYVGVLLSLFSTFISCEEDFTDIGSDVISNTKFDTDTYTVEITAENSSVESVVSDNISFDPGQYLLGVHARTAYEKIEASIISQIAINTGLTLIEADTLAKYETGTTSIVTTIDTVFIKLPYQATLTENTPKGPKYTLDDVIGDPSKAFTFNAYQSTTYLNRLDPTDPSKLNSYNSNDVFMGTGGASLNAVTDFQFIPNANDTVMVVKRWANNKVLITEDIVKYTTSTSSIVPLPFAVIPLNEISFKDIFLDKYESSEFDSQDAFNDYFRGLILQAKGSEGSLIPFNFSNTVTALKPSIEVYYTNTAFITQSGDTIKTFRKNDSFLLSGIRSAIYKMEDKTYPVNNEIKLQGAAGSEATIDLFGVDADNNGIADKIEELREKNWLINDASLTFYINPSSDTTAIPSRLYMYKTGENSSSVSGLSQIKDAYTETTFGGELEKNATSGLPEKYTFKITDYISDLISGDDDFAPLLKLKVYNTTDDPVSSTVFTNYNWNPKAVTLLNQDIINVDKRAVLKISYSEKKN